MLGYLTLLSLFATALSVLIIILKRKELKEIEKYWRIGLIVALADFIFEYFGTLNGHWTYNESLFFVFGLVPVELVFLFFSLGVIVRFLFLNFKKVKFLIGANAIFYALIFSALVLYIRDLYLEPLPDMMPLAIVVGLWGIANIPKKNRESALILAMVIAVVDIIVEITVIGSGSYGYPNGFSLLIPLLYGLYTLGILATIEKLDGLDRIMNHPLVRNVLKLLGMNIK
ncbi:MAG: hypothetical protein ABIE55_03960 [Candidatus Aenigmatarchaeota archaeon]